MNTEDLRALSHLGHALWVEPGRLERAALETLTAVSLLDLPSEKLVERASSALLERASRDGAAVNATALGTPFFRLLPEERLILAALHLGHWSYARISRILDRSEETVARAAWSARVRLATSKGSIPIPGGSNGPQCPEFDPQMPWTQRFLDEEITPRERLFLQNHLMACAMCRKSLALSRDLYYSVDAMLPRVVSPAEEEAWVKRLALVLRKTESAKRGRSNSFSSVFARSLVELFARKDVLVALAILLALFAYRYLA